MNGRPYILFHFPQVQLLMEKQWFRKEAVLATEPFEYEGTDSFDSAYLVPEERVKELTPDEINQLYK